MVSEMELLGSALTQGRLEQIINSVGNTLQETISVGGSYNIAARFCEPEKKVKGRENTVQLLIHGITVDMNYWSGGQFPTSDANKQYSWIEYASKEGYPTLSIDRLGYGKSDRPDPITVVQVPAAVEIHHQIAQALRNGKVGGRKFEKVAYVGVSYGSVMGNTHSAKYPKDFDAIVLTGYSRFLKPAAPGVLITPLAIPAALVDRRFSKLPLGYFAMSNQAGRDALIWTGSYDKALLDADWKTQEIVTVGEAISSQFINEIADGYTNPVLVITGDKDQIFCGLALPGVTGETHCTDQLAKTGSLYPNADYDYVMIPDSGHVLSFHYSAHQTFKAAHDFFGKAGL